MENGEKFLLVPEALTYVQYALKRGNSLKSVSVKEFKVSIKTSRVVHEFYNKIITNMNTGE